MLGENELTIEKEIPTDGKCRILAESSRMSEDTYRQYQRYHFKICEDSAFLKATSHFLFQCTK